MNKYIIKLRVSGAHPDTVKLLEVLNPYFTTTAKVDSPTSFTLSYIEQSPLLYQQYVKFVTAKIWGINRAYCDVNVTVMLLDEAPTVKAKLDGAFYKRLYMGRPDWTIQIPYGSQVWTGEVYSNHEDAFNRMIAIDGKMFRGFRDNPVFRELKEFYEDPKETGLFVVVPKSYPTDMIMGYTVKAGV